MRSTSTRVDDFVARAHEIGAPAELVEIDGADHGFVTVDIDPILDRSIAFLGTELRRPTRL
ncbi:hypothetical protein GCM10009776_29000 [Microbacterium deminutum]|uniref:Alpha/beta hydrolase fold-3 domain-containing protein n=1 Tax=Microbacterium deminutum TaxID=344164 RepID=A0ABP5CI44_9MICO